MQNEVLCCSQLLVGRSECVQCKIDWRVVEILGLMDRSKTTGQVIVWATVLCSVFFCVPVTVKRFWATGRNLN
jgi:hypothetical protein